MKKIITLTIALTFLLSGRAPAQDYQTVGTISFNGLECPDYGLRNNVVWEDDTLISIQNRSLTLQVDDTRRVSLHVDRKNSWNLGRSSELNNTAYFQNGADGDNHESWQSVYIDNLKEGDKVRLTTNPGQRCAIFSHNTDKTNNNNFYTFSADDAPDSQSNVVEFTVTSDGSVQIQCIVQYSGIHTIELQIPKEEDPIEQRDPFFNYDPGYEVYDFFEVRDRLLERNSDGDITNDGDNTAHTNYFTSDAGFNLNGNSAQYFTYYDNDLTLNSRIAISQSGRWRFQRGLIVPQDASEAFFSISNLKEGDRIQIFWTGEAPTFTSQSDGTYNGCPAFKDTWNDGDLNTDDGDYKISQGMQVDYIASLDRNEGTIARDENVKPTTLHTSAIYVVTEDGHMDFRLSNTDPLTRIVKVKIYSDHQATMIDDYSERDYQYTSRFDITGELQAKEHIVPGGLEVRVGNEDKSQHAIVVSSNAGPVSYVNAVDGFKLPGITKEGDQIQIDFNLGKNSSDGGLLPTTGTFYKFMPLESGTMKVKFEAYSMYYYRYDIPGNAIYYDDAGWQTEFDRGNEQTSSKACPYYVKVSTNDGGFTDVASQDITWTGGSTISNGAPGEFVLNVEAGKVYYLFGGWTSGADATNTNLNEYFSTDFIRKIARGEITPHACGVAELFDVAFTPSKQIYPLAKWVPSGTDHDDDLATIVGYHDTELTVKKMSGNITGCEPYIDGNKLKIRNITFKDGENPGGVILIKFGTNVGGRINYYKVDPVYVFTVAYDANYHSTSDYAEEVRGHTWDFSSQSLSGLDWEPTQQNVPKRNTNHIFENNNQNFAIIAPFGTYYNNYFGGGESSGVNTNSFLYGEMDYVDNGIQRSDWLFNYRLQKNGEKYDPRFLSKYDMEGDNADMIWETEGIILEASSNMSCMFNEFNGAKTSESSTDPDRYVGILGGSSFIIPHLNADDRVIIYMGSGTDTDVLEPEDMKFRITNARDALYKEILEDDVYEAGGSLWKSVEDGYDYRGCYHFFAKGDGDMKFTLEGSNSICKLYKIQIYHGDRIYTNEIEGDAFYQVSTENSSANATSTWTLKHLGKGEHLANNSGRFYQKNDISAYTGQFASVPLLTDNLEDGKAVSFSYTGNKGDIGTIRVRAKDMEKNLNYVADFAEHNITIAYQETKPYPYTWDFTDVNGYSGSDVASEWTVNNTNTQNNYLGDSHYNLSLWDNNGAMRLNSQTSDDGQNNIFESNSEQSANQLWANGGIIPESQGLMFYMDDNDPENSGNMQITTDGLRLDAPTTDWCYKMVVPEVPAGGAVYLRMAPVGSTTVKNYKFGNGSFAEITDGTNCRYYQANDNSGDYIVAIKNTGSKANMTLSLGGWVLKKMAVSEYSKTVNYLGYASESRAKEIDPSLMSYMTGTGLKAYYVSNVTYGNTAGDIPAITLTAVPSTNVIGPATEGDHNAYIIYNTDAAVDDTKAVNAIGGGFHLFVPDMHDGTTKDDKDNDVAGNKPRFDLSGNSLVSNLTAKNKNFPQTSGQYTNYLMNYKYKDARGNDQTGPEAFYRASSGASLGANKAYLQLVTEKVKPSSSNNNGAKFAIVFVDEEEGTETTSIDGVQATEMLSGDNAIYTLSGVKVSKPEKGGIYVKNGRKFIVK